MGLSDYMNVTFLKSDGNLEVIRKNNKSDSIIMNPKMTLLQWIKDIEAGDLWTPYVGMKFIVTDGSDDVIYHILNINDKEDWMEIKWRDNRSGEEDYVGWYTEDYYRMVEEDRIQIVHDNLNESEDLQWIKDINPIPELKVGSCFIDTMDPDTKKEWVMIDFRTLETGTPIIVVKNNIDSMYMHQEYFEQDLFNGRYKPCQR